MRMKWGNKLKSLKFLLPLIVVSFLMGCSLKHEHVYVEEIIKESTCVEKGEVLCTCKCGDSFTFSLPLIEHKFSEYVYDDNATFDEDGTETSTCEICGCKKSRTVPNTKLERVVTELKQTMRVAKEFTIVFDDGVYTTFTRGQEVDVTGISEDGFYMLELDGQSFFVEKDNLLSFSEYGYPEWYPRHPYSYFLFFDTYGNRQIESISREASDYRKIDSVSELRIIDGDIPPYQEFMTNLLTSEKVAYDCGGKTILLYDYSWFDNDYQMIVTYDFGDTVLANNIHSDASIGLFSTYEYFTWYMYDFNDNLLGTKNKYLSDYYLN